MNQLEPTGEVVSNAVVEVQRPRLVQDRFTVYEVWCDRKPVGRIPSGGRIQFFTSPGVHTVQLFQAHNKTDSKVSDRGSKPISLDLKAEQVTLLRAYPGFGTMTIIQPGVYPVVEGQGGTNNSFIELVTVGRFAETKQVRGTQALRWPRVLR